MTYPSPRSFGETGEINASFRPATATPDLVTGGGVYHYLATTASTDGEFGLYRVDMNGAPGGPSPHIHRTISESFFILSGRMRLFDGERWAEATAGDFLHVPVRGLHAFRNDSGEPASMLMLFAPGAPREGCFEGITELAGLTDEEGTRFFVEHDSYFTDIGTGPQGGFTRTA
ncbi:cupin domain-containing protein [Nonomuraea sp. SMC257]|uniref:Cupin domain-containing protein n=1 Tax=Nonomuraea montanisoli TaxID=2741721 RepID=A0A7Y6IGJ3_9ACTN|nr:cupin domain-containing protein [Nonomuraea montanisoli]NUW37867.1 cupin domain-containing protein [Nonomuraea montanisoli]